MDLRELFDQNPWWKDEKQIEEDYDIVKWREKKHRWIPQEIEKISLKPFALHVITGARQVGKTTALKLLIKKLLAIRNPKSIFYFNCENIADHKELSEILEAYLDFRSVNKLKKSVIMLDEITLPKEWYRAVKFFIDQGKLRNDVVVVTGSSSINVKREVELFPGRRGNGVDITMRPLSFREFLKVVDRNLYEKIPSASEITQVNKKVLNALMFEKELNKHLKDYMEYGGFPLSVVNIGGGKQEAKKTYLAWIKNAILKADRSDVLARQVMKVIVESAQSAVSWEGISRKIEAKSPKTVAAYTDLLKSIYAVNILYNIDVNEKKIRFGKNKKIHFTDPLLYEIFEDWCLTKMENKYSAIAEALVVEQLSRAHPDNVFFWKNNYEVDAVVMHEGRLWGYEVKWSRKSDAKKPRQITEFTVITKKNHSKKPLKIPLAVFLSIMNG